MIPEPPPVAKPARPTSPSWIGVRFDQGTTRVIRVVPGAPAEQAGVRIGDQVVSVDGQAVFIDVEAVQTIRGHVPGKTPFVVKRNGKEDEARQILELGRGTFSPSPLLDLLASELGVVPDGTAGPTGPAGLAGPGAGAPLSPPGGTPAPPPGPGEAVPSR